jgi:hypothetical protein
MIDDQPIAPLLDSQSNSPANTGTTGGAAEVAKTVTGAVPTPGTDAGSAAVDPNSQAGILSACGS